MEFRGALVDEIAPAVERHWKGEIEELDVIDSRTYLNSVGVDGESGGVFTVTVDSGAASGYASAIKRGHGGDYDYVGQRVAELGVERGGRGHWRRAR